MSATTVISTVDNITLVTLQEFPANVASIAKVLEEISKCGINIDMISMAPAHGDLTAFSITISDDDLGKVLAFTKKLRETTNIQPIVSSGNYKISVYDPCMKNTPGIAAAVFAAAARVNTDIRLISTSDVEISILVTAADYDSALSELEAALK